MAKRKTERIIRCIDCANATLKDTKKGDPLVIKCSVLTSHNFVAMSKRVCVHYRPKEGSSI